MWGGHMVTVRWLNHDHGPLGDMPERLHCQIVWKGDEFSNKWRWHPRNPQRQTQSNCNRSSFCCSTWAGEESEFIKCTRVILSTSRKTSPPEVNHKDRLRKSASQRYTSVNMVGLRGWASEWLLRSIGIRISLPILLDHTLFFVL